MIKRSGWLALLLVTALFVLAGPVQAQKSYRADRFDVDVAVQEDGSLWVTETVIFNFEGGPFTYVFRELPTDHTDGITEISASLDGRPLSQGDQPGQVEIGGRDPIRITWHMASVSDAAHTFVLRYHVLGVVRQDESGDLLLWQALPDEYEYEIAASKTAVTYPAGLELLGEPKVTAGEATVSREGRHVTFTGQNLSPNSPLVVSLRFPAGSLLTTPPDWQAQQEAQAAQTPIWLAISAIILVVGLVAVVVQVQRHRPRAASKAGIAYEPPDKLSPGLAAILLSFEASPTWAAALGTLFSLAEQGVLEIDESPEKKWFRQHDFLIRQITEPASPQPHEQALLDLLFVTKHGRTKTVKFSDLQKVINGRRWRAYKETVRAEFKAADLFSPQRKRARNGLVFSGLLLMAVGIAALVLVGAMGQSVGPAALAVGGSLMILGVIAIIAQVFVPPLTDEAAVQAAEWQRFANYLRQITRGKAAVDNPNLFFKYLPFAAAFSLLPRWTHHFEKAGWTEVPPYFHALPTSDPAQSMAAFAAMSSATSSAGGSAAGAAGAGAAGGGASGAG